MSAHTSVDALINRSLLVKDWRNGLPRLRCSEGVARELYALVGVLLRQFVRSWHTEIIDDSKFINELVEAIAEIANLLTERLQNVDIDNLILDDIPCLLDMHLSDYRQSVEKMRLGFSSGTVQCTYPALDHHSRGEQLYLTLLSRGLTNVALSKNELASPCARAFVCSIMKDIVVQNLIKLSEPWMVYDVLLKLFMALLPADRTPTPSSKEPTIPPKSNYDSSAISGQVAAYYYRMIKWISSLVAFSGRLVTASASYLSSYEKRLDQPTPLAVRAIFPFLLHLLELESRNPLLASTIHVAGIPFRRGKLAAISTEFVSTTLQNKIQNEKTTIKIFSTIRTMLFPNGYLSPGRPVPSAEEQRETRRRLVITIKDLLPGQFKYLFFGADVNEQIDHILDMFCNQFANKQLLYKLVDLLMANLFPELSVYAPEDIRLSKLNFATAAL